MVKFYYSNDIVLVKKVTAVGLAMSFFDSVDYWIRG